MTEGSEARTAMTDDQACQIIGDFLASGRRWSPIEDIAVAQLGDSLPDHIEHIVVRAQGGG